MTAAIMQSLYPLTMDDILQEFQTNGVSQEMDALDWIQFNTRRRKFNSCDDVKEDDGKFIELLDRIRMALRRRKPLGNKKHCVFCKNNKEDERVYLSHVLKDSNGAVICPILTRYTCPMCSATGAKAHTVKYCPLNDGLGTIDYTVKATKTIGSGRRRV